VITVYKHVLTGAAGGDDADAGLAGEEAAADTRNLMPAGSAG